ncbi:hypothetical protein N7G274_004030 [Stereocaulon virgatum]|uniref:Rhodopsin domain-containing protein n=1 Tax=Stereocaulon virgatum TaxID=373712 RepID=A0ABR4AAR5_9LECA
MEAPFPYTLNPSANKQPHIYGTICTVWVLAVASLALRVQARRMSKARLGVDDYLLIVSLVFATALFGDMLLLLHNGFGQHLRSKQQLDSLVKMFLFSDVTWCTTLAFSKCSILLFYWRLFGHVKAVKWSIYILLGLTTCWFVEAFLVMIFGCTPIASFWNFSIKGERCINYVQFTLPNMVINSFTDILILALPLPLIWRLQQTVTQKVLVTLMFLCGGFVCVVSFVRLVILLQTDFSSLDLAWSIADFSMWCTVEACFAIISASLPLLRPIYKASTSYVSCLYKRSTLSLSQSSKSFDASSRKDTSSAEDATLPMHTFQVYKLNPGQGHKGPIRIENEISVVYEPRMQIETRRNALEQGTC